MGHNGHGINLYGVIIILAGKLSVLVHRDSSLLATRPYSAGVYVCMLALRVNLWHRSLFGSEDPTKQKITLVPIFLCTFYDVF